MNYDSLQITCPHCWQTIDVEMPPRASQMVEFVADCEVCCRPIAVTVRWPDGEEDPELWVEAES